MHDPVTWYGINYAGTQVTRWYFQKKESRAGLLVRVPLFWKFHCVTCVTAQKQKTHFTFGTLVKIALKVILML